MKQQTGGKLSNIIEHFSGHIQLFLICSSVFERVGIELCNAVVTPIVERVINAERVINERENGRLEPTEKSRSGF